MTFRQPGLLATFFFGGLLLTACGNQDEDVTSAAQDREQTADDCSDPDVDCGGDLRCGDRLSAATNDPALRIALTDPRETSVRAPVVSEQGPSIEGDVEVLQITVEVTNTTGESAWISTTPHLLLADAETSTVVSSRDPRPQVLAHWVTEISAHETREFDSFVSLGSGRTCNHSDLSPGRYVAIAQAIRSGPLETEPRSRQTQSTDTFHYALLDVELP